MSSFAPFSQFATCLAAALLCASSAFAGSAPDAPPTSAVTTVRTAIQKQPALSPLKRALASAPVSLSDAKGVEALGGALGDDAQETLKDLKATQVVTLAGFDSELYAAFKALATTHSQESRLIQCLPGLTKPVMLWRLTKGASALNYERQAVTSATTYQQLQSGPSVALMATSFGDAGAHMTYAESAPLNTTAASTPVLHVSSAKAKSVTLPGAQETCKDPETLASPMLEGLPTSGALNGIKWKTSSANGWSRSVDYARADLALAQAVFEGLVQQREAAGDALNSDSSVEMWEPNKPAHRVRLRSYAYADGAQRTVGFFMDDNHIAVVDRLIPPTTK